MSFRRVARFALAALFTAGMSSVASAGCCGWGAPVVYAPAPCSCWQRPVLHAAPLVGLTPVAPAPIYIVNQGPDFTGPGIMVPYRFWFLPAAYVRPWAYPYFPAYVAYGYGHRYFAARPYHHRPRTHPRRW